MRPFQIIIITFAVVTLISCGIEISKVFPWHDSLTEITQNIWNGSSMESIKRILKAEEADFVIADPVQSRPELLAGALRWTRRRETILVHQNELLLQEIGELRMNISKSVYGVEVPNPLPLSSEGNWPMNAETCAGLNSNFLRLEPLAPFFEPGPRLDGIHQSVNISDKYVVTYCLNDADRLSGVFRLEKFYDCNEMEAISDDTSYTEYVREHLGPDEFILNLEGPEIHALHSVVRYHGRCRYELPFHVTVPAKYRINLIVWRENYNGARENLRGWLPAHYDVPLGEDVYLILGKVDPSRSDWKSIVVESLQAARSGSTLPDCNLHDPQSDHEDGRWVYAEDAEEFFMSGGPTLLNGDVDKTTSARGFVARTWIDFKKYTWRPFKCRLRIFSPEEARVCLFNKRIMFQGDSHMRQSRNALLNYICGITHELDGQMCGLSCAGAGLENVCVEKDPVGDGGTFMLRTDMDLNIANMGQHFICVGMKYGKFSDYTTKINALLLNLAALKPEERHRLAWHETVAFPLRKDTWITAYGDQRTNHKLKTYNKFVNRKMRDLNISVIPAFQPTVGMVLATADNAHFELALFQQSTSQFILNLACPP